MKRPAVRRGFSVIELLVVLLIMSILAGLAARPLASLLQSMQISQAVQYLVEHIHQARQAAASLNRPATLRIYRYAVAGNPGETTGNPATGRYRALQVFLDRGQNGLEPFSRLQVIDPRVVIADHTTFSTLLRGTGRVERSPSTSDPALPGLGRDYLYQDLVILPSGVPVLPASSSSWTLTLYPMQVPDSTPALPPDFASIAVNPLNSSVRIYRP